jgi:ribonuclease P protein component
MKFGEKLFSRNLILFIQRNDKGIHRLGIVVKKEIGTAVFRNRIKRYFREFFRLHKKQIPGSMDMIILVKRECTIRRYEDAERELKRLLISKKVRRE